MTPLAAWFDRSAEAWVRLTAHAAWQGALVGAAALLVVAAGRRVPSPIRYGLLLLALLKFAIPPFVAAPVGLFSLVAVESPARTVPPAQVPPQPAPSEVHQQPVRPLDEQQPDVANAIVVERPIDVRPPAEPAPPAGRDLAKPAPAGRVDPWRLLALLHLAGAAGVLAAYCTRAWRLRSSMRLMDQPDARLAERTAALARQLGLRRIPQLCISGADCIPFSAGIIRPVVVLPARGIAEWSRSDLDAVLAHELVHHRRGDLWVNLLQVLLGACWWFHPVVWLLNRALRSVREECCDDWLLSRRLVNNDAYCATLLRVARDAARPGRAPRTGVVSMLDGPHPLAGRIRRIMDVSVPRRLSLGVPASLALLVAALLLLPGLRTTARETLLPPASAPGNLSEAGANRSDARPFRSDTAAANEPVLPEANTPVPVSGRVTDARGAPVAGASVALCLPLQRFESQTTTDADGQYLLEQSPRGDVLLTVVKPGLAPYMQMVVISPRQNRFDVALAQGQSLRVRVVDTASRPIAGAQVVPSRWPDTWMLERLHQFGTTDADGLWTWDWAPATQVTLRSGSDEYLSVYTTLPPGGPTHEIVLQRVRYTTIRVIDEDNRQPVTAFRMTLGISHRDNQGRPSEQWLPSESVESAEGTATHTLPFPGPFAIRIEAGGYEPAVIRHPPVGEAPDNAEPVAAPPMDPATAGDRLEFETRLRPARARSGIVVTPEGTIAADVLVQIGTASRRALITDAPSRRRDPSEIRTDGKGGFQFDVPVEPYSLFVVDRAGFASVSLEEEDGAPADPVRIVLQSWGRIAGTLQRGPTPLAGESLRIEAVTDSTGGHGLGPHAQVQYGAFTTHSDNDGRFALERVPPGVDLLVVQNQPIPLRDGWGEGRGRSVRVRLAAGEALSLSLGGKGAVISGSFQKADESDPIDFESCYGELVRTTPEEQGAVVLRSPGHFRIDRHGGFRIDSVLPGHYRLAFGCLKLNPGNRSPSLINRIVTIEVSGNEPAGHSIDLGGIVVGTLPGPRPPAP